MPEFFSVDRLGRLSPGQALQVDLNLVGWPLYAISGYVSDAELEGFARDHFGTGLSRHGKDHLLSQHISGSVPISPAIELVFELVRRASFPERPSRLSSAFGWSTLDEARKFKAQIRAPAAPTFRVSCDRSFRCDMDLLRMGNSILVAWLFADKYWRGEQGPQPKWEELLIPPVTVLEQVE